MPARPCPFSALGKSPGWLSLGLVALLSGPALLPGGVPAARSTTAAAKPIDPALVDLLKRGSLEDLAQACQAAVARGDASQVQLLQQRLLTIKPAPQPLALVLANADVLLTCQAPDLALQVLARYAPAPGPERTFWLVMQWRAAAAGLQHGLAAQALRQLAGGKVGALESRQLPVQEKQDGTVVTRPAIDLLAAHLESLGRNREAAEVLLASRLGGAPQAERFALAVSLLDRLPGAQRQRLMELALEQAAASGSWGLVAELLDQQLALEEGPGTRPSQAMQRRLRLSGRIDDAYGEWLVRRRRVLAQDPVNQGRLSLLDGQLRSPRSAGGHAHGGSASVTPSSASPATMPSQVVTPIRPSSSPKP